MDIMVKRKSNILLILFIFFLIYYPPIIGVNLLHIIACFSYIYLIKNFSYLRKACRQRIELLVIGFSILIVWLLLICLIEGNSFGVGIGYLQIVLEVFPSAIAVGICCHKKGMNKDEFFEVLLIAGTIQGIISVVTFVFPNIQEIILNQALKYGFDNQKYSSFLGRRYFGLAYNLVTYVPVCQSFFAVMAIRWALNKKIHYFLMVPFLAFSAIINGRSALVILGVGLVMLFIEQLKKVDVLRFLKIALIATLLLMILGFIYSKLEIWSPRTYMWLDQGIEEIKMFVLEGETGAYFSTISNVSEVIPKGSEFIAGIGEMSIGGNSKGIASDIGYINYLWMGGVVFFILVHCIFFCIIFSVSKYSRRSNTFKFISSYLFLIAIIFNVKMPVFSLNEMMIIIMMIYSFLIIDRSYDNKKMYSVQDTIL